MKDELFEELVASVKEGGAILRGEVPPSRTLEVPAPDVQKIRAFYKLSQPKFAALLGISLGTLRNWEQGRRAPQGPARVLLHIAEHHPEALEASSLLPAPLAKKRQTSRKTSAARTPRRLAPTN